MLHFFHILERQLPYLKALSRKHVLVVIFFQNTELDQLISNPAVSLPEVYHKTIAQKADYDKKVMVARLEQYGIQTILTKPEDLTVNTINKYLEIKQCQLIQKKEGKYQLKINIKGTFYREKEFVEEFKKYLGADADITVVYVDEIPLLASGKMRMMVNEMLSSQHRIGNIYEKK